MKGHLATRLAGVALIIGAVVMFRASENAVVRDLVLPVIAGAGALMTVRNAIAVALGAGLLAAIHTDLTGSWIERIAYPAIGAGAFITVLLLYGQRFRARIAATHAERWNGRRASGDRERERDPPPHLPGQRPRLP